MKSLIVDDHKINYVLIKNLLNDNFPEIDPIDEAESVEAALLLLQTNNYDLIFLDMQLRDGVGFDVLKEITEFVFVIVISSHKDYALEAFKHNVIDYLVKPIRPNEFKLAVNKVLDLHRKAEAYKHQASHNGKSTDRLFINDGNEYKVIERNNILYIKADGNHSEINTTTGEIYKSTRELREFEDVTDNTLLLVHPEYLVNVNRITSYSQDTTSLKLTNGIDIPVSENKKDEVFKIFNVF